jgi:hypothetical protein
MTKVKSLVSRRRLIGASLMIPLVALAIWHFNTRSTSAQGGFESAIFTVSPKAGKTFLTSTTPGTTFQVEGDITLVNERGQSLPGDDGSTGQFYRTGVVLDSGFSLVTDVYVPRSSNAYITASGILKGAVVGAIEKADLLSVTGGVGTFRSVTGEAQLITTDAATGKFTVRIEEGLRRLGQFQ